MFIRAVIVATALFAVIGVVYMALDWFMRRDTVRRLERAYEAGEGGGANREDYIEKGLATYERSTAKSPFRTFFS
ncbi:MAG: hypothetical protein AAGE90_06820, partial [Pseudomonadota bacterium]